jgi:hypothetical protein
MKEISEVEKARLEILKSKGFFPLPKFSKEDLEMASNFDVKKELEKALIRKNKQS